MFCNPGFVGVPQDLRCSTVDGSMTPPNTLTCAACGGSVLNGTTTVSVYCPGGDSSAQRLPCSPGYWGDTTLQFKSTPQCSGPCDPGYFCPAGSTISTAVPCGGTNFYCPQGSAQPVQVSTGFYSTPATAPAALRTGQAPCPTGRACADGVVLAPVDFGPVCSLGTVLTTAPEVLLTTAFGPTFSVTVRRSRTGPTARPR